MLQTQLIHKSICENEVVDRFSALMDAFKPEIRAAILRLFKANLVELVPKAASFFELKPPASQDSVADFQIMRLALYLLHQIAALALSNWSRGSDSLDALQLHHLENLLPLLLSQERLKPSPLELLQAFNEELQVRIIARLPKSMSSEWTELIKPSQSSSGEFNPYELAQELESAWCVLNLWSRMPDKTSGTLSDWRLQAAKNILIIDGAEKARFAQNHVELTLMPEFANRIVGDYEYSKQEDGLYLSNDCTVQVFARQKVYIPQNVTSIILGKARLIDNAGISLKSSTAIDSGYLGVVSLVLERNYYRNTRYKLDSAQPVCKLFFQYSSEPSAPFPLPNWDYTMMTPENEDH